MDKLKPCPFCGEKEDIGVYKKMHHGAPVECNGYFWRVECLPCGAKTEECTDQDAPYCGDFKTGKEAAIAYWNRRSNG